MVTLKNTGSCSRTHHILAPFYMNLRLMGKLHLLLAVCYHRKSIASCLYPGSPRSDINLGVTSGAPCGLSARQVLRPHCGHNQPHSLSDFCEGY